MAPETSPAHSPGSITIQHGDRRAELPIVHGTEGEIGIDIRALRGSTGMVTLDPGFGNTGACKSAITFIDGEKGILRHRGYSIEELASNCNFLEVSWLLLHGELPNEAELESFDHDVSQHTLLHENFRNFFGALPKDAHPMPACAATVGALSTFYQDFESDQAVNSHVIRLLAKMPTIAAWCYKHSIGQPFMYPKNDLGYAANFLQMMFSTPCEEYEVNPTVARVMEMLLVLHADHEQNCSTSTVRIVGSSKANLFASISAGIGALWGPLHGGANQKVIEMLQQIAAEDGDADKFIARAKDKDSGARLMGFGHRVYKSYDPRAAVLKTATREVMESLGTSDQLLDIALRLEEVALQDEYFIERSLFPNVDFYSGIIYKAIGIPVDMFTVLFAMGRLPGWIAHWLEMRDDPDFRIGRPRQIYTGPKARSWSPIDDR